MTKEDIASLPPVARNDKIQIPLTPFVKGGKRFSRDNVIFTPHIAFYSQEAIERIMEVAADNINSFIAGQLKNTVKRGGCEIYFKMLT